MPPPVPGGGDGGGGSNGGGTPSGEPRPDKPGDADRDSSAPVLSKVKLTRRRFRVGTAATAVAAGLQRGTKLSFRSSEAGTLAITFERKVVKKRRTTYRKAGTVTRRIRSGDGAVALSGRVGKKRLAAGSYRLTLVASDGAGNRSKPVRISLTIVKG